jgi:hypothetical protein
MADNLTANAGSGGATIAFDDISSTFYQRVKPSWGADGAATDCSHAAPMPVATVQSTAKLDNGGTQVAPARLVVSAASAGDNTLLAAQGAGNKIRVLAGKLVTSGGANSLRFESAAGGTALTGVMTLADDTQFDLPYCPVGHFETAANELLNLELANATSVAGWLVYVVVV